MCLDEKATKKKYVPPEIEVLSISIDDRNILLVSREAGGEEDPEWWN